jgi:hypothetical protein
MSTEQTGRQSLDTTDSIELLVSPAGGDPTPLPEAQAAEGTKRLKAAPPPIPSRTSSQTIPPPRPRTASKMPPLPAHARAKGTVPPVRATTADPDGWVLPADSLAQQIDALAPKTDAPAEDLRDILAEDPEGPDATTATPFHEPAVDQGPSKEWLAKIDSVLRPETSAPVFTKPDAQPPLFTTKAAVTMFEQPQNTQPLELVDLEAVEPPKPVAKTPVSAPKPSLAIAPQQRVKPLHARRAPVATPSGYPIVQEPDLDAPTDRDASGFDIDVDGGDLTSAHTTGFEVPAKQSFISRRMLIAAIAGAAVLTVAIVATRGGSQKAPARAATTEAPAPVQIAQPVAAPAQQPVAAPVQPPAARPSTLQIPVSSNPPGALVSFVDGGHAVVVGRTPITVMVDPSQPHDIALTLLDHETQLATIPAGGMTALAVDMGPAKAGAMKTAPQQVAVAAPRQETPAPKRIARHEAPKHVMQQVPRAETPSGSGVLMISSKPPCEIVVDGRSTHLMTPQKSIPLKPGTHTVMLVNAGAKIHKSIEVAITAKKPTKVIQDFTRH